MQSNLVLLFCKPTNAFIFVTDFLEAGSGYTLNLLRRTPAQKDTVTIRAMTTPPFGHPSRGGE